ncbi:MAG: 2-oxo acid dehydrogenase subunit E2 [Bauldia sp.]
MAIDVLMPALSPTMEEGTLAKWLVRPGDEVAAGDVIAEIETDKATLEVEAAADGTVEAILVPAGTAGVKVNAVIARLGGGDVPAERWAKSGAALSPSPLEGEEEERGTPGAVSPAGEKGPPVATTFTAPAPAAMTDRQILAVYRDGTYEHRPHDSLRKIIARRLTGAKQTIPHIYLTADAEIDALVKLRMEINQAAPEGADGKPLWRVSVNDMVIKALALSLLEVPEANVTWTEGGMLHHRQADVGVAVAIPGGLITPVVRNAETKPLAGISNEMKDFAERARARRLLPEEYQGGSTSVSNLGMYGTKEFAAVINPPQATILAVGAGAERAVVHSGALAVATVMTVTLSADHRAVDGAIAAELLRAFKRHIEKPAGLLV